MDGTNGRKETTLGVNVFTYGRRAAQALPRSARLCPITSTLIFGEHDAVLVDAMMTAAEAEALANWVAL
jgi:hypothetical protein